MRVPDTEYTGRPWRLHEIAPDFTVEDVWALPTPGGPDELDRFVHGFTSSGDEEANVAFRALFAVRWWIGRRLGWDRREEGVGGRVTSLRERLPEDLARGRRGRAFASGPFVPVYQTDDEYVAELANRTVHGLMHVGWVAAPEGRIHHALMTALVRPHGRLGRAYMAAIRPVRRTVVYPSLLRAIGREWPRYPTPARE